MERLYRVYYIARYWKKVDLSELADFRRIFTLNSGILGLCDLRGSALFLISRWHRVLLKSVYILKSSWPFRFILTNYLLALRDFRWKLIPCWKHELKPLIVEHLCARNLLVVYLTYDMTRLGLMNHPVSWPISRNVSLEVERNRARDRMNSHNTFCTYCKEKKDLEKTSPVLDAAS